MQCYATYQSPVGILLLASDGRQLTGLDFVKDGKFLEGIDATIISLEELPVFQETKQWLDLYFAGERPNFQPSLAMQGTAFRKEVWDLLLTIPYGETMTYGELAKQLAQKHGIEKMSAQAVGGAVGHNPIAIIVPCHRVLGTDGTMTGFGGGLEKKIWLLQHEGVAIIENSDQQAKWKKG